MLWYFESTLSWRELMRRTYHETLADNGLGLAAQLAYYFLLALFPAVLCVIALASFLPLQNFTDEVAALLGRFAPPEMVTLVREQMARLADGDDTGLFSIGLLAAIWSSSAAMVAMIDAMNRAYDIEEGRPWWKVRLIAILLTISLAVFFVLSAALIVAGPQLVDLLASWFGFGHVFTMTWKVVQWPLAFALVTTGIALVYYYAPDVEQSFTWITPGSVIAATLWVIASLGFRVYVVNFGNYEATYGTVTGVILLLLWFYISGLTLIIGAEATAEIEHASPWRIALGENVPGQKTKVGSAAGRAFRKQKLTRAPEQTVPVAVPLFHKPTPATGPLSWFERAAGAVLVLLMWRKRTRS